MYRIVLISTFLCGCGAGPQALREPVPGEKVADCPVERRPLYETEGEAVFAYHNGYGGAQYFVLSHDTAPSRLSIWWRDPLRGAMKSKFPSVALSSQQVEELLSAIAAMKREAKNAASCETSGYHRSHLFPGYVQYDPDTDDPTCRTFQDAALTVMRIAGVTCGTKGCRSGSP